MTRSLLVLAAIAAASVAGFWIHAAATHEPAAVIEAPEFALGPAASAPDAKVPDRAVAAKAGSRPPTAMRGAEPVRPAPSTTISRSGAAMRIAKDPVTGELVAPEHSGVALTIEEIQDLARHEAEGLVTIRNPDGSETLNHDGRFADFTVIRVGPDGKPVFECVHGRSGVKHALSDAAPATPTMEDR